MFFVPWESRSDSRAGLRSLSLCCLIAFLISPSIARSTEDPAPGQTILVRQVHLINPNSDESTVAVNILISNGALEQITPDEIDAADVDLIIEGEHRIVLGIFDLGQAANFLLLDGDPRSDPDIVFDTKAHTLFSMRHGKIVRNFMPVRQPLPEELSGENRVAQSTENLETNTPDSENPEVPPKKKKTHRWIGYTPPPMALPLAYWDSTKWNQWESDSFSGVFIGAIGLDRQYWFSQDMRSDELFGNLRASNGGEIRALRFGAIGEIRFEHPWIYTVFATTNAFARDYDGRNDDSLKMYDYRVDIPLGKTTALSIGKQKEPISIERLSGGFYLSLLERPAVLDAMLPARNIGFNLNGTAHDQRITWAVGVFNNWFEDYQSFSESSTLLTGRLTWLPIISDDDGTLLHLGLGMRYSNASEGIRYRVEPEFKQSPLFVDTGLIEADDATTWDLEAAWRRGPYTISGEYLLSSIDAPRSGNPSFNGYYLTGSWILTGEMRPFNRKGATFGSVPVAQSVYQGGRGAWELATRYSSLDLDDGEIEGGKLDIFSLGLAWYLTNYFHIRMDYRHVKHEFEGQHDNSDGVMMRLVFLLK